MAIKTFYATTVAAVTPNWWSILQDGGSAPTAANTTYGFQPGSTALSTPYYAAHLGQSSANSSGVATSPIGAATGPVPGNISVNTGDSFIAGPYTGTFAAGTWTLSLKQRAGTAGDIGHLNMRIWRSTNVSGSGATELTSGALIGTAVTLSTSADVNGMGTTNWSPGAITLTNEYIFFQLEWQETTLGSSGLANVLFRVGTSQIITPDFAPPGTTQYMYAKRRFNLWRH